MADVFCDDGGSNTAPYETWAAAATTLLVAVDHAAAGDDIMIGHDHAEVITSTTTYDFPGTAAAPNRFFSALSSAGGSVKTYTQFANLQVDGGGGARDIGIRGVVHIYGVSLETGDDFIFASNNSVVMTDCDLELSTGAGLIQLPGDDNYLQFNNVNLDWTTGGAGGGFFSNGSCRFDWNGGSVSWTGTQPTALFNQGSDFVVGSIRGVDLSAITSALVDMSDNKIWLMTFSNCLLNSGVALTTGAAARQFAEVLMSGSDDTTGNNLYRLEFVDFWGSTVHDDAIFRDDGASDGITPISWKMVSTANASEFNEPTKSPPIYSWVDATGSTTFTVNLNWDSASDLQDDEVWLEIEFLEASADTDSGFANDRVANITSTPVDQANNSETWTGTSGFTNENTQEVAVTVTVNRVGPVIARVYLAKPSTTIYVDPLIVKS